MSKNIIITGGTRGIGKAILENLFQNTDYKITVISKNASSYLNTIGQQFSSVDLIDVDLSSTSSINNFANSWGNKPLYALINNAGICKTAPLGNDDGTIWDEVISTNLNSVFYLTNKLVKNISNFGRIINISSQLGVEGRANYSAYCASKFAIIGLTKTWAKELGKKGITVNAICPGWVDTEMSRIDLSRIAEEKGMSESDFRKQICEPLELKRFTEPAEVANLISFLVSDKGSGITGRDWLLNTVWNQE